MSVGKDESSNGWVSTTDIGAVAEWLRTSKRVVVLTHVKPDGDAIGSTLAAARAINLAAGSRLPQPVAVPWYWGPLPDWAPAVMGKTAFRVVTEESRAEHDHREDPDAVLILDTGSWSQLHEVKEWLLARHDIAAVIDHHRQGNPDVAPRRVIQVDAAAACEPVAELCRQLLRASDASELPVEVAEPLYLGLATDTGWFRHSNVSPSALRLAAGLLETGVDHAKLYEMVEQRDRVSRIRLMSRALGSLEMHHGDKVAVMTLTLKDFEECRAAATDSAGFSEIPLSAEKIKVSVLITEAFRTEGPDHHQITKVSFRAKSGPGGVNVGAVAAGLGGGGHIPAAGAKLECSMAEAKKRVVEALEVNPRRPFPKFKKPPLRVFTTTLWEYPSQHYDSASGAMQGSKDYAGATPSWVIWQLLQRYTRENDLVVDPMCGSGTTLDVARDLKRRGLGYDLTPSRDDIFKADARKLPLEDEKADFVFIDPPYSTHLEYSDNPADIGKLDASGDDGGAAYYRAMEQVIAETARVLKNRRYMGLYVSDSWRKRRGGDTGSGGGAFMPIGFELFAILRRQFKPVDIIAVVRQNQKLQRGNWNKAAEEGNFFLRGFNYLFIVKKEQAKDR